MRIVAAIQARMGSSRLPNKVMALIQGKPMAIQTAYCAMRAQEVDLTVLSIPRGVEHDALAYAAMCEDIPCFRGQEQDLLDRTLNTACAFQADAIVRITADCPLTDDGVIDSAIQVFHASGADYVSNVWPTRTYPAGIAVEVYSTGLLEKLDLALPSFQDGLMRYREYFMVYLWEHASHYRIASLVYEEDLSHMRWTVDYPQDLEFVRQVYDGIGVDRIVSMANVLELLKRRPDIAAINAHIETDPYHGLKR